MSWLRATSWFVLASKMVTPVKFPPTATVRPSGRTDTVFGENTPAVPISSGERSSTALRLVRVSGESSSRVPATASSRARSDVGAAQRLGAQPAGVGND